MILSALFSFACGPKAPVVETVVPTPTPATESTAEEVETQAAEPEPEPQPTIVSNTSFNMSISFASGETKSGKVLRVERSSDYPGLKEEWQDSEYKTKLFVESGSVAKDLSWTEIKSVSISYGTVPKDVNCLYDSTWTPWMYDCSINTNTKVIDTDGKTWGVDSKYLWRVYFDGEMEPVDFWIQKPHATEQDDKEVTLDTQNPENTALYQKLQEQLKVSLGTTAVTKIIISQ